MVDSIVGFIVLRKVARDDLSVDLLAPARSAVRRLETLFNPLLFRLFMLVFSPVLALLALSAEANPYLSMEFLQDGEFVALVAALRRLEWEGEGGPTLVVAQSLMFSF